MVRTGLVRSGNAVRNDEIGRAGSRGNDAMARALAEAAAAGTAGEVPVGAVLVDSAGGIIAAAGNQVERDHDPTAHAEMLVLREAARLGAKQLGGCDLYVSLEPCPMCAAAIALAHVRRLYFAAYDAKGGGVEHGPRIFDQPTCHHRPEVYGGIAEAAAGELLRRFFRARR
jgi:tRNA(adenine34) deaminase